MKLIAASDLAQLREIRVAVETLAPRASSLDAELPEQRAVQHFYNYLDVRSKSAVRDGNAALRVEHADIERTVVALIGQLRRVDRSGDLDAPVAALHEIRRRIDALTAGTEQRWMLERVFNYARWHRERAEQRATERWRTAVTRQRGTGVAKGPGAGPAVYRPRTVGRRDRGIER